MNRTIYPKSFNPITNKHINIIKQKLTIFDQLTITITCHPTKTKLFSIKKHIKLIKKTIKHNSQITINSFQNLLINYTHQINTSIILKKLHTISNFEYKFQITNINQHLNSTIKTYFIITNTKLFYISSSLIHKITSLNNNINNLIHPTTTITLQQQYNQ